MVFLSRRGRRRLRVVPKFGVSMGLTGPRIGFDVELQEEDPVRPGSGSHLVRGHVAFRRGRRVWIRTHRARNRR